MDVNLPSSSILIRLLNIQTRSIKELRAFQKQHRVPASVKEGKKFLHDLAQIEIQADLEEKFSALRNGFGFKRREVVVVDPDEGVGSIETPYFNYGFSISFLDQDPTRIRLQRVVKDIRETAAILNPVFVQVFGNQLNALELSFEQPLNLEAIVDAIEDQDSPEISVQYDKNLTWCEIHFADGSPPARVANNQLSIISSLSTTTPADLLKMLADVQRRISQVLSFDSLEVADHLR